MIHYEEPQVAGQPRIARGKVCWLNIDQLKKHIPLLLEQIMGTELSEENLLHLKEQLIKSLKKEGFVFFDTTLYRYRTHKGKLTEVGISFHHIN